MLLLLPQVTPHPLSPIMELSAVTIKWGRRLARALLASSLKVGLGLFLLIQCTLVVGFLPSVFIGRRVSRGDAISLQ